MCGIVGYVGGRAAQEILLGGLEKLEYRGYDSAGIAVLEEEGVRTVRAVGNLSFLQAALQREAAPAAPAVAVAERPATVGIGHTRWATHGRVSEANAHPHDDTGGRIHIVLNGIVENFVELRRRLTEEGAVFTSDTDAEVVAHLIANANPTHRRDLTDAVRDAYTQLRGHYAFVAMSADEPDALVGVRRECPLVVGRGEGETFFASAMPAFLAHTRSVQYVNDDEIVTITRGGVRFQTAAGVPLEREVEAISWDVATAEKEGYESFMLKEIHEQAEAIAETVADRAAAVDEPGAPARRGVIDLGDLGAIDDDLLRSVRRIIIVACGTSYHAGLIGRYAIEEWARLGVETDIASEYRYRNPVVGPDDLVVGISQSGETADTLAAMRLARRRGAKVLAITNIMGSQATRDADGVLYTRAGLEIGVAATKTFVAQVAALYLLALRVAEVRGAMAPERLEQLARELKAIPEHLDTLLGRVDGPAREVADLHARRDFFLYLGRHVGLPVALEGALKLKEISYIATDAYAAGEMKHGPIALLDESTPVVCVATQSPVLEKVVSNMEEVRARGAHVIAVATEGDDHLAAHAEQVLWVPKTDWMLQPLLAVVPLQLVAYHVARRRGLNVDQPRNLAKTVTVE